jgi:hypothetical protein
MREYSTLALVLLACGGQISAQPEGPSDSGGDNAVTATSKNMGADLPIDASADTGADEPVDASGLPAAFAMTCVGSASPIAFQLPCAVGNYPLNVTECYALGDTARRYAVFQFMVPLGYLSAHRNEPIDLSTFPPGGPNPAAVAADGVAYAPAHRGTLTVSQVSATERAYVGRLQSVEFTGLGDGGAAIVCSGDGPFWAIPGGFL